jgi:hypothetical protein
LLFFTLVIQWSWALLLTGRIGSRDSRLVTRRENNLSPGLDLLGHKIGTHKYFNFWDSSI